MKESPLLEELKSGSSKAVSGEDLSMGMGLLASHTRSYLSTSKFSWVSAQVTKTGFPSNTFSSSQGYQQDNREPSDEEDQRVWGSRPMALVCHPQLFPYWVEEKPRPSRSKLGSATWKLCALRQEAVTP